MTGRRNGNATFLKRYKYFTSHLNGNYRSFAIVNILYKKISHTHKEKKSVSILTLLLLNIFLC